MMIESNRRFSWNDDACLYVLPSEHSPYMFAGSLAECVRHARKADASEREPGLIEIVHGRLGLIQIDQIREMAADPSFPVLAPDNITVEDFELGPVG
jgi:hypothetical protein